MNPQRIRAQMKELGLSIPKLAERANLSESTVKRALNGERMSDTTAALLARALNVGLDWLREEAVPDSEPVLNPTEPTEPVDEPTEPPTEPEDEDMRIAMEAVVQAYRERLDELKATYLSQIADLKRDKRVLAIAAGVLMLFVCALFTFDILNPSVGWFQY